MNILITGGTVFVSRFCAEYFVAKGHDVFVLNRNSSVQSSGVTLLNCDRHDFTALQNTLSGINFDAVIDVTAYTADDVEKLCMAINKRPSCYILISSSAVYPENALQPFGENTTVGVNKIWGDYGTNKIAAENKLLDYYPNAYILRPPYLYGQMNNLYREAFVFECAERNLPFYLPKSSTTRLHFFHIENLCHIIQTIIEKHPDSHILNVGNPASIHIKDWVALCYKAVNDNKPIFYDVDTTLHSQRSFFPFHDYQYELDVTAMMRILDKEKLIDMQTGLKLSYDWYKNNRNKVNSKPYLKYIEENFK